MVTILKRKITTGHCREATIAASWASEVALRLLWDWTGGALNLTKLTDQWRTPFQLALAAGAATELQGLLLVS